MTVSLFDNSVDLDQFVFHCTCKFLLIKVIMRVNLTEKYLAWVLVTQFYYG